MCHSRCLLLFSQVIYLICVRAHTAHHIASDTIIIITIRSGFEGTIEHELNQWLSSIFSPNIVSYDALSLRSESNEALAFVCECDRVFDWRQVSMTFAVILYFQYRHEYKRISCAHSYRTQWDVNNRFHWSQSTQRNICMHRTVCYSLKTQEISLRSAVFNLFFSLFSLLRECDILVGQRDALSKPFDAYNCVAYLRIGIFTMEWNGITTAVVAATQHQPTWTQLRFEKEGCCLRSMARVPLFLSLSLYQHSSHLLLKIINLRT